MDSIDSQILDALRKNARVTHASLGAAVGLSPHATADRIRRLRRDGVIIGFTVEVDYERLGRPLQAVVDVRLLPQTPPEQFERLAESLDAVNEIIVFTGRFDYQLRLVCESPDDLDRSVRMLRQHGGVAYTETHVVMRRRIPPRQHRGSA
jgi:Lrp/AsnC family leucine-responsive transcriptional regulator